jgi:hypothetical protein
MCCAIVALAMTVLASWRSVSNDFGGRAGWWRRTAIAVIAIAAAAGSAMAADRFAADARFGRAPVLTQSGSLPVCGHLFR